MTRHDQREGEPYGSCRDCDLTFADEAEMSAHLRETYDASAEPRKGHTGSITNPTRMDRIRNHLSNVAQDALYEFIEDVDRDVERGDFTEEEVAEALRFVHMDPLDTWNERDQ